VNVAKPSRSSRFCFGYLAVAGAIGALSLLLSGADWSLHAAPPLISYIQNYSSSGIKGILIHFNTEPNLNYQLQWASNLGTNGLPSGPWSDLFVVASSPSPNHFIVYDNTTNKYRFYRLHAFP
jgi:hypothetical protein